MKVVLAVNAHISKRAGQGPGKVGYSLAKALFDKGELGRVFCYSADTSVDLPRELFIEALGSYMERKLLGLSHRIAVYLQGIPLRRLEEQYFDWFASRMLSPEMGNLLFCTKPVNPLLIEQARRSGWMTALATSILHPRFNLEMVSQELRRLGLRGPSVYTDEKRVQSIERALRAVDRILTTSRFFSDNYRQYGVDEAKFAYPPHHRPHEGVDLTRFSPLPQSKQGDGTFRVLHVSHMTLIKGVQYLLEAWKRVEEQTAGELVLFGPQDANIRNVIKHSGVRRLRLAGPGNPIEEYRRASVFVSPSVSDAGPNTVFEAMACGTPAIVSNHCGVSRYIVSGKNGFVYQYDDVERLCELLLECARDRDRLTSIGTEALNRAREFPLGDYTGEILAMLA
jgi:glycosyltransferase involved in cell wall biosynthesis